MTDIFDDKVVYLLLLSIRIIVFLFCWGSAYVEFPLNFVYFWLSLDCTLKVDVVSLLDVLRLKSGAEAKGNPRQICKKKIEYKSSEVIQCHRPIISNK